MSGYAENGWTSFTETRWRRYFNRLPDDAQPEGSTEPEPTIFARCRRVGIGYYLGASRSLFAQCGPGRLWTILSGRPSSSEDPLPTTADTQWLSVTDIGFALTSPELSTSAVLKLLRQAGFLERVGGKDAPTDRAADLCLERDAVRSVRYAASWQSGTKQRVWAYAVLEALREMDW